ALWAAQPRFRCFLAEAVFKVLRRQDGLDEGWCTVITLISGPEVGRDAIQKTPNQALRGFMGRSAEVSLFSCRSCFQSFTPAGRA
ncbi:hypothetical protein, partial [Morganella morganii]|uniref:hypothetical protein n=1 Tax=Morganella morganii TaxID=582 RepID=UPI00197BBFDD